MKKISSNKLLLSALAYFSLLLSCYLMVKAADFFRGFKLVLPTIPLFLLVITLYSYSKFSRVCLVIIILIYSIYSPFGFQYHTISYEYLISAYFTNQSEAKEFLTLILFKNYLYASLLLLSFLMFIYLTRKHQLFTPKFSKMVSIMIIIVGFIISPFAKVGHDFYKAQVLANNDLHLINNIKNNWGTSTVINSDDIYVLVIGESARKDYHHAYGYPVNNTPFMSGSKGILIDGFATSGLNTVPSLKSALTLSNKEEKQVNYNLNLIDLMKSAGFKTYWLSNQGMSGIYDSPISTIAFRSDEHHFLKMGGYSSLNTSDFSLLPYFNNILKKEGRKFIVLHLYGSHPNPCERIIDYENKFITTNDKYNYISCYISSINKTDDLLKDIYNKLMMNEKRTGQSFSMLYFSDHGISHTSNFNFTHNPENKQQYEIPLFMVSSHSLDRKECSAFKTNLNFTEELANFMGIKNKHIKNSQSLFDCKNDEYDYGEKQRIVNLNNDNAIDIRPLK